MRTLLLLSPALLLTLACTDGDSDGWNLDLNNDAVIVGQIEGALRAGRPNIRVNGQDRDIELDEDRGFAFRGVPTGDVIVEFEQDDVRGSVTVTDVEAGEVLDIDVVVDEDGGIHVRVDRGAGLPFGEPELRGGDLIYGGKNSVHQLRAGVYDGNLIIEAKDVTVLGARDRFCDGDSVTIIAGDLIIRGKNARVVDVVVLGNVIIERSAKHAQLRDTCAGHPRDMGRGHSHSHDHDSDSDSRSRDHDSHSHSHDHDSHSH